MVTKRASGFTLTELAITLLIMSLLLTSLIYTLSAQSEQRSRSETLRRLEDARELLLTFAVVQGRLPCPARSTSAGDEVRNAAGECKNGAGVEDYYGGTLSDGSTGGFLPATAIGFAPVDSDGFALDAWGNRIRYVVARTLDPSVTTCADTSTTVHFTLAIKLKSNGITCLPRDLIVCNVSQSIPPGTACSTGTTVTNRSTVVALVFSTGKNGALGPQSANEAENLDGDHVFVHRTPDPAGSPAGEYDDLLSWIPVGQLYGRLIAAGVLP
jgi:prepilin-type N-terminal cleavage/methylation domain-containing protein